MQLVEPWPGDGHSLLAACAEHRLEGVVSKRLGSPYRSGASSAWLKAKCFEESEFVVVGWRGRLAHLLLAEAQVDELRYVGRVRAGWMSRDAAALLDALATIETPGPVLPWPRKPPARWCRPLIVARVRHLGRDSGGHVRHASFRGVYA